MMKKLLALWLAISLCICSPALFGGCTPDEAETDGSESGFAVESEIESKEDTSAEAVGSESIEESKTEENTENDSGSAENSETVSENMETEESGEVASQTESDSPYESESEKETECVHEYSANIEGHWKPACDVCGKGEGRLQDHEFEERVEDEGDLILYSVVCPICKYTAYEQEVPYEINTFYSAGELANIKTSGELKGSFGFDTGVGYATYTGENGGSVSIILKSDGKVGEPSGKYLIVKLRLPASQSTFGVSIKSVGANSTYDFTVTGVSAGWVTVIMDATKAISSETVIDEATGEEKTILNGYHAGSGGQYYLGDLSISAKANAGEHLDIAYVILCDHLEDAQAFTMNPIMNYDIESGKSDSDDTCYDENGNVVIHNYISDADGHTLLEPCYYCGKAAVQNEPHTFVGKEVNGELSYVCSICGYSKFGADINKYFTAEEINTLASSYTKVNQNGVISTEGMTYASFTGKDYVTDMIFVRNRSSINLQSEKDAAFSVGSATYFMIRVRTNDTSAQFTVNIGTATDLYKGIRLPTSAADQNEWTTYIIDLSTVIPTAYIADESGEYRIMNLWYYFDTFATGTTFDIEYMAFVDDDWDEVKALCKDENAIYVISSNVGMTVNVENGLECTGAHLLTEKQDGNTYKYICSICDEQVITKTVPESVTKYFSANGVINSGKQYGNNSTRSIKHDGDTPYGQIIGKEDKPSQFFWMRAAEDFKGNTGNLGGVTISVGKATHFVIKLRSNDSTQPLIVQISTTGRNGDPDTDDDEDTYPQTHGYTSVKLSLDSDDGEWIVYVADLTEILPDHYVAVDGEYILDTFYLHIEGFSDTDKLDIAYMAFIEGEAKEIDALVEEDTVRRLTNKDGSYVTVRTDGTCTGTHVLSETLEGNTYKYFCSICGEQVAAKTVSEGVTMYISAHGAIDSGYQYGNVSDRVIECENSVPYGHITGKNDSPSEMFWMRATADRAAGVGGVNDGVTINVGRAKYFVIKARSNDSDNDLIAYFSTTEKSADAEANTNGYTGVTFKFTDITDESGWVTYVADLSTILPEHYVANADGEYVLDTFYLLKSSFADTDTLDIAYMAFVDGELTDIDESSVRLLSNRGGAYETVILNYDDIGDDMGMDDVTDIMECIDFVVSVPEDRDPVILQITDPQIIDPDQRRTEDRLNANEIAYWASEKKNSLCYDYLREIIEATDPDLILVTGDIVFGEFDDDGSNFLEFIRFMEEFQIPWAPVFGNHENESKMGADWQCDQLENAEYCLFLQRELTGNGNYTVGIEQGGEITRVFFMLDSNGCGGASDESLANGHTQKAAGFGLDQIKWYTALSKAITRLSPATKQSFVFHIQISIFEEAFAKYNTDGSEAHVFIDYLDEKQEGDFGYIGAEMKSPWDSYNTVWNGLKELGIDSIFVGHEHANSASIMYEGIRLQYGMKSSAYDRLNYISDTGEITSARCSAKTPWIGGTVFSLSDDGSINDPHLYFCENAGGNIDWDSIFKQPETETEAETETETESGTENNSCENGSHLVAESANGSTYTYICTQCGDTLEEKTIPDSVTKYFSANEIINGANSYKDTVTRTLRSDNGSYYGQLSMTVTGEFEFIWKRSQADYYKATGSHGNAPDIEVGKAKYFVIKLRSSDISDAFFLRFSTTGKSGDGYAVADDGTVTYPSDNGYTYVRFLANAISSDEWTTFVVDLETVCPDYYVIDETTGEYVIDTFMLYRNCTVTGTLDIEYMAFTESLEAVSAIAGEDVTVKQITNATNGTYEIVDLTGDPDNGEEAS